MANIDLHIHTKNSDGEFETKKIIKMLKKEKIKLFSITDHDDIKSCTEMEQITLQNDMKYIPGIEFSSIMGDIKCHILGYNIDYKNQLLKKECEKIRQKRYERILVIIEYIEKQYGINITPEEKYSILTKAGTIGRTDIYKILIRKVQGTKKEIFDKYLTDFPKVEPYQSEAEKIINLIKASGGTSILAHPKEIEQKYQINIDDKIEEFIELGLDGIEIFNSIHTIRDMKRYHVLAQKYELTTTGGSDYHGPKIHPEIEIGRSLTTRQKIKIHQINYKP